MDTYWYVVLRVQVWTLIISCWFLRHQLVMVLFKLLSVKRKLYVLPYCYSRLKLHRSVFRIRWTSWTSSEGLIISYVSQEHAICCSGRTWKCRILWHLELFSIFNKYLQRIFCDLLLGLAPKSLLWKHSSEIITISVRCPKPKRSSLREWLKYSLFWGRQLILRVYLLLNLTNCYNSFVSFMFKCVVSRRCMIAIFIIICDYLYSYTSETNHAARVYNAAAVVCLEYIVLVMLFPRSTFRIVALVTTVRTMCVVPSMAVRILQFIDVVFSKYALQTLYEW